MEVITSDDESGEEFSELKKIFARENKQSVSNFVEDVVHKYSEDEVSTYNYFISNKKFISNVFVFSFDAIFGFPETQQICYASSLQIPGILKKDWMVLVGGKELVLKPNV